MADGQSSRSRRPELDPGQLLLDEWGALPPLADGMGALEHPTPTPTLQDGGPDLHRSPATCATEQVRDLVGLFPRGWNGQVPVIAWTTPWALTCSVVHLAALAAPPTEVTSKHPLISYIWWTDGDEKASPCSTVPSLSSTLVA